ncbi:NAD(P)/FAD-dependent oxidoreductase [Niallia endozanthoxylica]|uniref:NAD(P)/FAD-dependent oxidoreductase n=1 Tax=Niallia endozanthoxylica TaxID=2036016 RepID=A0A5J5H244_9BACI|nr:FAD-dependent oxidoreductase [Niallia endozanthoxylica]KAA9014530.1 NAD(P)/FAD-dependent oxidoreductase [Niallia endozanthoxylica]
MNKNYCIIGTGVAAVNAAKAIRDQDKEAHIHVFGAEKSLPYNRIKLSKDLYSDLHSEKVLIKKEKWYKDQNILVHVETPIININMDKHEILTTSGEIYNYDKLLICTGSQNRKLAIDGADKKGVFTIREMHEADDFKAFIEGKQHVVNIGGGIQGLETAWSIHKQGKKVSIIEAAPRLMARQLDERTSSILKKKIEEAGVQVYVSSSIESIKGETEVEAIVFDNHELDCDSVIYAIGVIPNVELVKNTEIAVNRGIIVNERMQTNVEDVYAAGDVAEWNGEVAGLWNPAMDQGKVAGKNMAETSAITYQKSIPSTVFNAFDFSLFSIGLVDENQCDITIIEEDQTGKYTRVFIKDDKMVGVISLEGVVASLPYKAAIESEVSLKGIELSRVTVSELMNELKKRQQLSA